MADNTSSNVVSLDETPATIFMEQRACESVAKLAPTDYGISLMSDGGSFAPGDSAADALEKWFHLSTEEWKSDSTNIFDYDLPGVVITKNLSSPLAMMFKNHKYWRGDMVVKVQLNSNKFMVGRLLITFYYGQDFDDNFAATRGDPFSHTQMLSVLVSASSNNVAELRIPYAYTKPFISTRPSTISEKTLYLGRLNGKVFNSLRSSSTVSNKCSFSLWVKFENNLFTGLLSNKINPVVNPTTDHQVVDETIELVHAVDRLVTSFSNRDQPTSTAFVHPFIPRSSSSLATGKNDIQALSTFHLDARAVTPSMGSPSSLKVRDITREWGFYYKYISSESTNVPAKLWISLPVSPFPNIPDLHKVSATPTPDNTLPCYGSTPIAVVSSMFSMWRGSIEYRFDFVASQFHTARYMLAFVPDDKSKTPSFEAAKCSYNVVFDLEEDNSVIFVVPYLADAPWWPIYGSDLMHTSSYQYTGYLCLYTLNPLITMDNIPNTIELNVYVRAGEDFELAVPSGPLYGLSTDLNVLTVPKDKITFAPGYGNVYVGTWRNFYGSTKCILRYGTVSDHVAQLVNAVYDTVYEIDTASSKLLTFKATTFYWASGKKNPLQKETFFTHLVVPKIPNDTPRYAIPFFSQADALQFIKNGNDWAYDYVQSSPQVDLSKALFKPILAQHQVRVLNPGTYVSQNYSQFTFGESFDDLKDLLRRFQLYMRDTISVVPGMDTGLVCFRFPVVPSGLPLKLLNGSDLIGTSNAFRQGHIPLILSGFRFFRGSIRLKIVFVCDMEVVALIQFIPNVFIRDPKNFSPDPSKALSHYGLTYPTVIQASSVNKIVELEVPFYMNSNLGLLQRGKPPTETAPLRDIDRYFSLGSVAVSFLNTFPTAQKIEMNVFYSVGDDFDVYLFQGFPAVTHILDVPMFDRPEIPPKVSIKPEEFPEYNFQSRSIASSLILGSAVTHQTRHQILVAAPLAYLGAKKACEVASTTADTLTKAFALNKAYHQTDAAEVSSTLMKMIDQQFGDLVPAAKQALFSAVSQLVHSLLNPSITTIAWSLTSFFISIGFLTYDSIGCVSAFFEKILTRVFPRSQHDKIDIELGEEVSHQTLMEEFSDKEKIAFISVCVAGISSMLGMAITIPSKDRSLIAYINWMLKGFTGFVFSVKVILDILTKTMGLFSRICNYFFGSKTPDFFWKQELMMNRSSMVEWAESVNAFTDPAFFSSIEKDIALQKEVFDLAAVGNLYIAKSINTSEADSSLPVVKMLSVKINKLKSRLVEKHMVPAAKFEPFVFQLYGPTNIGKSTLQFSIGARMLKKIGYSGYGEFMYTRTPGNKHLNTLSDQKIFVFDDFLQVRGSEIEQENISELFCLKSRGIYNPPMAELADKRIRYSPLIVMLSSNEAFWQLNSISDINALYRRRDTLWYAQKKKEYADVPIKQMPESVRNNFEYLYFLKVNPTDPSFNPELYNQDSPEAYSYESFADQLNKEWYDYYLLEMANYKRFLSVLYELYPGDESMSVDDYKRVQRDHVKKLLEEYCANERRDFLDYRDRMAKNVLPFTEEEIGAIHQVDTDPGPSEPVKDQLLALETIMLPKDLDMYVGLMNATHTLFTPDFIQFLKDFDPYPPNARTAELVAFRTYILKELLTLCYAEQIRHMSDSLLDLVQLLYLYNQSTQKFPRIKSPATYLSDGCMCLHLTNDYTYLDNEFRLVLGTGIVIPTCCPSKNCVRLADPLLCYFIEDVYSLIIYNTSSDSAAQVLLVEKKKYPEYYFRYVYARTGCTAKGIGQTQSKYNALIREALDADKPNYSLSSFITWFVDRAKSLNIPPLLLSLFKLLGLFAAGSAFYKLFYRFYGDASSEIPQSGAEAGPETREFLRHGKQIRGTKPYKSDFNFVKPGDYSSGTSHQTVNTNRLCAVLNALSSNAFVLSAKCGVYAQTGKGLGIFGNVAIILKHHYEGICKFVATGQEVIISITRGGAVSTVKFEECDFRTDTESSICFIKLPRNLPFFKKIIHYFPLLADMETIPSTGLLVDTNGRHLIQNNVDFTRYDDLSISESKWASGQRLCVAFKYYYAGDGLCGSSLLSLGSNPRIVGIHIAGNGTTVGYSQPVFQELLVACGFAEESIKDFVDHECLCIGDPKYNPEANVIVRGRVNSSIARHYPKKSKIVPSPLHDLFPAKTTPAPLSSTDPRLAPGRDIFAEAIRKRDMVPYGFDRKSLDLAIHTLSEHLNGTVLPLVAGYGSLLEYDAVVCGIDGIPEYNGVDMRTSEGFPWVLSRPVGAKNKSWLFEIELDGKFPRLVGLHPELVKTLDRNDALRYSGIIPPTVFCDSLKDSRIAPSKIDGDAPTRLFSMSPVDFTLSVKRYFGHFQAALIKSRILSGVAVGINPDSMDWQELYAYLSGVGDLCFEGDYKAFGDTLDPGFVRGAIFTVNAWYRLHFNEDPGSHPQIVREVIGEEISHAVYIVHDCLYQALCGIPSGCPITVEINSLVGLLYIYYIFFEAVPNALRNTRSALQLLRPITYGDDFVVAFSRRIYEHFNGELFRLLMSKHGIRVTNSNKTQDPIPDLPIDNATFLKRGFAKHPSRPLLRLAPIDYSSIQESVLWMWDSAIEPVFQSMATCRSALDLAFSRGPEDYFVFKQTLTEAFARRGYVFQSLNWDDIDARIFDPPNSFIPYFDVDTRPYNLRCTLFKSEGWAPLEGD